MTTEVAIRQPAEALAIKPGQDFWTEKQKAALSVLGIKGATNADLAIFFHYCQKTQLDPFSRQVYGIMRREKQGNDWVDKFTIQTGIDGFRVIRDRVAERLGVSVEYEDTIWYDDQGAEYSVWLWDYPPSACKVVVLKDGKRFPAVLRTAAYAATSKDGALVAQWRTQPEHMIEKCCEAMALRRAFPHDLDGLYIEEEMPPAAPIQVRAERVTAADIMAAPQTPAPQAGPSVPDAHDEATPQPAAPAHRTQAGKPALDRLTAAFEQLDLDQVEQETVIGWLAGGEWTASTSQVKNVTSVLTDFLAAANGDRAEARTAMWERYRQVTGSG